MQTRGDAWCKRPADAPKNSPLPRFSWLVQHAMIATDAVIYRAMESLKPVLLPGTQGRLLKNASITKIAQATARYDWAPDARPMPRRTVAHRLLAMERKGILIRWDAEQTAKTSPFGASWQLPTYDRVLQAWADNPNVGTVPPRRAFYTIGKARRLLTPEELAAWNLNHAAAEQSGAQATVEVRERPEPRTPAFLKPPPTAAEEIDLVLREILEQGVQATPKHAADLIALARTVEPAIPGESITRLIHEMSGDHAARTRARRNTHPLSVGWYQTGMEAAVHRWRHERKRAQDATKAFVRD